MDSETNGIDLREIGAALLRGGRWILLGGVAGLVLGVLVLQHVTPRFQASTSVLIRSENEGSQGALARLSGMVGGVGGLGSSTLETEIAILQSRSVLGSVVDSLGLQVSIQEPQRTPPGAVFARVSTEPRLKKAEYRFRPSGAGYRVSGPGVEARVLPGGVVRLPGAVLWMREGRLPESFTISISSREAAIDRVAKGLKVLSDQGDVVEIQFRATDPVIAAAVPNLMVSNYLRRRRTTDRGVNQHRHEFLSAHADSVALQLAHAERALRHHQERSGVLDPQVTGRTESERIIALQAELEAIDVEARALGEIVRPGRSGRLTARELAAYPTLLRNPAIASILTRLLELETQRTQLLGRRTERDVEVRTLDSTIEHLDNQLVQLSTDYLAGLNRQRRELQRELAGYHATLGGLPASAEVSYRLEREVKRLSETLLAMQAQLVQARLEAISEGGEVRQIDPAVAPEDPIFPNRPLTLFGGLIGGLFFSAVATVVFTRTRQPLREPWEAALAVGAPVGLLHNGGPLLLADSSESRCILVVPVGSSAEARPTAERICRTAVLQGKPAVLVDVMAGETSTSSTGEQLARETSGEEFATLEAANLSAAELRAAIGRLEEQRTLVVVALPSIGDQATIALLDPRRSVVVVARSGEATRSELAETVRLLSRIPVVIAGIVLEAPPERRWWRDWFSFTSVQDRAPSAGAIPAR